MTEFFAMGGYAAFIWPAFAITAIVLTGLLVISLRGVRIREARLNALKVILNSVDYGDRNPDIDFSVDPQIVFSGREELDRMDEERDRLGRPRL